MNNGKEIYRNGLNRIIDNSVNYILEYIGTKTDTNVRWMLDRDDRAIRRLIDDIEQNGAFGVRGYQRGGKHIKTAAMSAYRPYGYDPAAKVYLCDGDCYNLRSSNLHTIGDVVPYTQQRRIWQDGRRIWIKLRTCDDLFFTTFKPDLYALLCNTRLGHWFTNASKRMLYCRFFSDTEKKKQIGLGAIVWFYDHGMIDFDHIEESVLASYAEMKSARLQIDHLRDNRRNCCIHNIAAMPIGLNSRKNDIVTQINDPYLFIPARVDDAFHIVCGRLDRDGNSLRAIRCDSIEQFVRCVKQFRDVARANGDMLPEHETKGMTNCIQQRYPDDGKILYNGKCNPISWMLDADASQFQPWDGDFSWLSEARS